MDATARGRGRDPEEESHETQRSAKAAITASFASAARSARIARSPASRDSLIAGIAEALIERAMPRLLDPDAHAVTDR